MTPGDSKAEDLTPENRDFSVPVHQRPRGDSNTRPTA